LFNPFEIANQSELQSYIYDNTFDPWDHTPFKGYVYLGSKKQGAFGERFIASSLSTIYNLDVVKAVNSGHDRIVNCIKAEFKFTLASRDCGKRKINPDGFSINHVAIQKDWERLIVCAVNPEGYDSHLIYITKEDFIAEMQLAEPIFKSQQGGDSSNNDDYFIKSISGCKTFFDRPYIKSINTW